MAGLTILRGRVTRLEGGLPHVEVADLGSGVVHGPLEVATPSVIVVGARVLVAAIGDATEDLVVVGVIGATASGGSGGDPVPVSSPTAPDAPAASMLWADETTGRLRRWIGGVWRGISEDGHTHSANDVNDGVLALARLPVAPSGNSNATQVVRADDARLSDPRAPTGHAHAIGDLPVASSGEVSSTKVPRADDARLSDSRAPLAHNHDELNVLPRATVCTNANSTLTGLPFIDGYQTVVGDRVLCVGQTTSSQNGPWLIPAGGGAWVRPTDFDSSAKAAAAMIGVARGTLRGGKTYRTTFLASSVFATGAKPFTELVDASHTHAAYALAYSTWFANIVAGTWNTVTHNLSTEYVNPQFLVGTPAVPYELEWENVAGDNQIRFRADVALADVGVLIVGW